MGMITLKYAQKAIIQPNAILVGAGGIDVTIPPSSPFVKETLVEAQESFWYRILGVKIYKDIPEETFSAIAYNEFQNLNNNYSGYFCILVDESNVSIPKNIEIVSSVNTFKVNNSAVGEGGILTNQPPVTNSSVHQNNVLIEFPEIITNGMVVTGFEAASFCLVHGGEVQSSTIDFTTLIKLKDENNNNIPMKYTSSSGNITAGWLEVKTKTFVTA